MKPFNSPTNRRTGIPIFGTLEMEQHPLKKIPAKLILIRVLIQLNLE